MSKEDEDRINNLVAEIRMLEGALNDIATRQSILERVLIESRTSVDTVKGLDSSTSEEIIIPVGGGMMLRASPPKVDRVLLNIGANVVVEKSKDDAVKFMEDRAKQLEGSLVTLLGQRNQIAQRLDSDRRAVQALLNPQGQ